MIDKLDVSFFRKLSLVFGVINQLREKNRLLCNYLNDFGNCRARTNEMF